MDESRLWKYSDLAKFLERSEPSLRRDVMNHSIPFIRIGRLVRFHPAIIKEWLFKKNSEAKLE